MESHMEDAQIKRFDEKAKIVKRIPHYCDSCFKTCKRSKLEPIQLKLVGKIWFPIMYVDEKCKAKLKKSFVGDSFMDLEKFERIAIEEKRYIPEGAEYDNKEGRHI